ncbi:S-adenosyl methyltransferase [Haloactinospora alba]|uniref:S-adenosyl methyltransferase n=1 Tax=Haloactinospora alba TaxID=405555 RepID=A0A543N904_9ACTN|nr:SAM-dependent methyltransferase [Haloactinospora alba]TQN28302.1 S-adenosyl methyltransferase [Haloactinospora alba]
MEDPTPDTGAAGRVDPEVAHNARVWNHWLGGKENYPADRELGDSIRHLYPEIVDNARADRAFLGRAVRYLVAEAGVRRFLDIGTGLPTADNTHEVAQALAPESRVVYVDNDPLVLTHARALLTSSGEGATDYVDADLRDPRRVLRQAARTLDLSRPVALMLLGVVNFLDDDHEARRVLDHLSGELVSGSYLVISHPTDVVAPERAHEVARVWNERGTPAITVRTPEEITALFAGWELVEPGLVSCPLWRPEPASADAVWPVDEYAGVAVKP